jgi:hypothetical protein
LKIKLNGRCIDAIEMIGVGSRTVVNALTEHDFQDAFKMAEALGAVYTPGRELLRR